MTLYVRAWRFANRIRRFFGRPPQPKRCCRKTENLGPVVRESATLSYRRCTKCRCRHFELTANPGHLGIKGA